MKKNSSKFDKLPLPLIFAKRANLKEDPNPYRIGEELKQNNLSTSRRQSGLAEMKQQLLQIKDDMIKLFIQPNNQPLTINNPPDILYQTLKQQLSQQKLSEDKLRKEIQKNRLDYLKAVDIIKHQKDSKIEHLKHQKENLKTKYDKTIEQMGMQMKNMQLKSSQEILFLNNKILLQKNKYNSLISEFNGLEDILRQMKQGNLKNQSVLLEGIQAKRMNIQLSTEIQSMTLQLENYKFTNLKLQEQIKQSSVMFGQARNSISVLQSNQLSLLQRLKEAEEYGFSNFQSSNSQLSVQRKDILNLQLTINDLQEQNYVLAEHNKFIKNALCQTQEYADALQIQLRNFINKSKSQYEMLK